MPFGVAVPGEEPGDEVEEELYRPAAAALAEWAAYREGAEMPEYMPE